MKTNLLNLIIIKSYLLLMCLGILVGCDAAFSDYDPEGAETIYTPTSLSENEFMINESKDNAGYVAVSIEHMKYAFTDYYALWTPANNLRFILSGCSECGELKGYKIKYDKDGAISEVIKMFCPGDVFIQLREKDITTRLKTWAKDQSLEAEHYSIQRDEYGKVTSIGDVRAGNKQTIKYYISEWGPFWDNDVSGGVLGFFVWLIDNDKKGKSAVDYLYVDGHLIAELAYWDEVFIKALFYNREGLFYGITEDRQINILDEAFWIYDIYGSYNWYSDTKRR